MITKGISFFGLGRCGAFRVQKVTRETLSAPWIGDFGFYGTETEQCKEFQEVLATVYRTETI